MLLEPTSIAARRSELPAAAAAGEVRVAGRSDELGKSGCAFPLEAHVPTGGLALPPLSLAGIDDEPPLRLGNEPALVRAELCLLNHASSSCSAQYPAPVDDDQLLGTV